MREYNLLSVLVRFKESDTIETNKEESQILPEDGSTRASGASVHMRALRALGAEGLCITAKKLG